VSGGGLKVDLERATGSSIGGYVSGNSCLWYGAVTLEQRSGALRPTD
jgi:hypothetical protein